MNNLKFLLTLFILSYVNQYIFGQVVTCKFQIEGSNYATIYSDKSGNVDLYSKTSGGEIIKSFDISQHVPYVLKLKNLNPAFALCQGFVDHFNDYSLNIANYNMIEGVYPQIELDVATESHFNGFIDIVKCKENGTYLSVLRVSINEYSGSQLITYKSPNIYENCSIMYRILNESMKPIYSSDPIHFSYKQLTVYPSLSRTYVTVLVSEELSGKIFYIQDELGRTLTSFISEVKNHQLNIQSLPSGKYFIRDPQSPWLEKAVFFKY